MKRAIVFSLLVLLVPPLEGFAEDWYGGATFVQGGGMKGCMLARFKASDGSFTLAQADVLYTVLFGAFTSLDVDEVRVNMQLPSEMKASGHSGEELLKLFLDKGTGVCDFGGEPADAVGFVSSFSCEYQNENQMCFRLYINAGTNDLSMLGIPSGTATIGGLFVKRELWDVVMSLLMTYGDSLLNSLPAERSKLLNMLVPTLDLPIAAETD